MKRILMLLATTQICFGADWNVDPLDLPSAQMARLTYLATWQQAQAALKPTFELYQLDPNAHQIAHAAYRLGWQDGAQAARQAPDLEAARQLANRNAAQQFRADNLNQPWYQPTARDCIIVILTAAVIGTAIYLYHKHRK